MAAVTICSDFGAQKNSLTLIPLFPHLFPIKWWDQMPWSSFSECWALSQLFHSPLSLSSRGFLVPLHEPEIKLPTSTGSSKKQESSRKTSISALLTMPKPLTVWITKTVENSERDGNTKPPDLPLEKWRRSKEPLDKSERGEWKSWLKAQHSEN